MKISRIKETCIYVNDLHRTKAFYADTLGLPVISFAEGRHVFFRAGESVLLCFIAGKSMQQTELPPHGAAGSIHFAFEVSTEEYKTSLQQVKDADIPILHEHMWENNILSFYFHDPDNNLVEVIEGGGLWE